MSRGLEQRGWGTHTGWSPLKPTLQLGSRIDGVQCTPTMNKAGPRAPAPSLQEQ